MNRDNISNWSFGYFLLKAHIRFFFKRYFRKIIVTGNENIKYDEPIIFASLHQNALSDPFVVLFNIKKQPVFMARADIFNKPFLIKLLSYFKILPIYRIRDGRESLQNNDEIFNYAIKILEKKRHLVILPEGSHAMIKKLRALKKGICRIAFQAEKNNNYNLGVKIIPVGIEYEHYTKFFKTLYVNFGKPIEIKKYFDLYKKNPNQAINDLKDELAGEIKKLMINIKSNDYYKTYNELRYIYEHRMKNNLNLKNLKQPNRLYAHQQLIKCLDNELSNNEESIKHLNDKVKNYVKNLNIYNQRDWVIKKGKFSWLNILLHSLYILIFFPLFLYGLINNFLPYIIPYKLSNMLFKDPAYRASARSVAAAYVFPIFYIIQFFIVKAIFNDYKIAVAYLISITLFGYFALLYSFSFKKLKSKLKFKIHPKIQGLKKQRQEIIEKTDLIVKKHLSI